MGRKKDVYRAAKGSGFFPLTFNFVYLEDGCFIQCAYCGLFVNYRHVTRDHVYPKSKGGLIKTPACIHCNDAKEDMLPLEWALYAYKHGLDIATIPIGADYMHTNGVQTRKDLMADIDLLFDLLLLEKEEYTAVA